MKGQQKISRGTGFRGALNYDFDHDGGKVVGGNMDGTTPRDLAAEFSISRKLRPDIEKPVWRNSLSLPPGEKLSDEKWAEIAQAYMSEMGFDLDKTQYVVVMHDKTNQQHIHITASRIALDKTIFLGKNENLASTKKIAILEKQFGLVKTKMAEIDPATGLLVSRTSKKKPRKNELEKSARTGFKPPRLILQEGIDDVLRSAKTGTEFMEELKKRGILYQEKTDDLGKIVGITFETVGVKFGGSKLGDAYRHSAILKKLKENKDGTTSDKTAKSAAIPSRHRPAPPDRGYGIEAGSDRRRTEKATDAPGRAGSAAEENRLLLLKTRNRIFSYSQLPLRITRLYRLWKGRDGRVWLYNPATGQPTGLAFSDTAGGKELQVHRPTADLTAKEAEMLIKLAVESGIAPPLTIYGDVEFVVKMTAAAHRLGVKVKGDNEPLPIPDLDDLNPDKPRPRQRI